MPLRRARSRSPRSTSKRWSETSSVPEAEAVVDASPLILLSRIGQLELLLVLERPLAVPLPVFEEIQEKGSQDRVVQSFAQATFFKVVPAPLIPDSIERWVLGKGESS